MGKGGVLLVVADDPYPISLILCSTHAVQEEYVRRSFLTHVKNTWLGHNNDNMVRVRHGWGQPQCGTVLRTRTSSVWPDMLRRIDGLATNLGP